MPATGFQAPYATKVARYVYIPMRDGVRLACDVYRPAADGAFPCVMVRTPYNKNGFGRQDAEFWVRRGYALCVVDARGSGGSEGLFTYYNIPAGLGDGADVVDWLAGQPWCNGRVGTFGGSALGAYQILTAPAKPKALKAMFVEVPPVRFYHDNWFPGGIFESASRIGWLEGMTGNTGPNAPVAQVEADVDPEGDTIRRGVALWRLRERERRALEGKSPTPQDWFVAMRNHPEAGGFWDQFDLTPIIRECDIPTVYVGVWYDHFIRGTCEAYELHRGPSHLILTPGQQGTHGIHCDVDSNHMRLRWFDYHLKGIDNGVVDEPPVKAFVMGAEQWRTFSDWPPKGDIVSLGLSTRGSLTDRHRAGPFRDAFEHDPENPVAGPKDIQDIRDYEERAVTYTSEPLEADLCVAGSPAVRLFMRSTAQDAHVMVKLTDVHPDGRSRLVTFGRLRAAHREGHDRVVPLVPGEVAELAVPLWPTANTFKAGHRIRLAIAGSEVPRCDVCPLPSTNTLIGNAEHAAILQLPTPGGSA